ncbi:MAG: nonstructural protein [Microvirus sp.]|nr:MAG: nonstructural protein [Microvirus sp.]
MQKSIYTILDSKAGIFCNPFISINDQTALRDFLRACTDPSVDFSYFPADYTLFHIGFFDEVLGTLMPNAALINLGTGATISAKANCV